jgi:hypothetical protein
MTSVKQICFQLELYVHMINIGSNTFLLDCCSYWVSQILTYEARFNKIQIKLPFFKMQLQKYARDLNTFAKIKARKASPNLWDT